MLKTNKNNKKKCPCFCYHRMAKKYVESCCIITWHTRWWGGSLTVKIVYTLLMIFFRTQKALCCPKATGRRGLICIITPV